MAFLRPLHQDRSYPVVLRCASLQGKHRVLKLLLERLAKTTDDGEKLRELAQQGEVCLYVGEMSAAGLPRGPWRHWMHLQTVNDVPPGTDPVVAAQTIGGLAVSSHFTETLDVACGPFVFKDDGSFDIELLSI